MFAKRPAPVIGKLPNPFISGGITCWDASTSPKSPLEYKILSPRGPINCDLSGIGLGIVAAMEKYSDPSETQLMANKSTSGHRNKSRSDPVPVYPLIVGSRKGHTEERKKQGSLEDYTFVTGRGSDNAGSDSDKIQKKKIGYDYRRRSNSSCHGVDDFLSNCHMCQKNLHGKDIYMYRGEKGYCSTECRLKQIMMDENKEKYCKSTVTTSSRSVQVSSSPCQNGRIFFSPEILVDAI